MKTASNQAKLSTSQADAKPISRGNVRVGLLRTIPELLRAYSRIPLDQVFAELDIEPSLLDNPENGIPFKTVGRLLELCETCTGIPHFGLMMGQRIKPADVGQLAKIAVYAPDVRTALRMMIVHVCINDRGGASMLTTERGIARLGYVIYEPLTVGSRHIYTASLAIIFNLLRSMCGASCAAMEVHFSHSRPDDISQYKEHFKAPLIFDSDMDTIVFPEAMLETPIATGDAHQFSQLLKQIHAQEEKMAIGMTEKIRSIVRPMIVYQGCSLDRIAKILAIHPRTLNRRLKNQGTTLRRVIGETRFEMAKQMLLESDATVAEISTLLGYSDSSVLARSFHRWSNQSPSEWRQSERY